MAKDNVDLSAVKARAGGRPRRVTLSDVAREAGVSPVAVSVVLNGSKTGTRVSEASRERIISVARRLRYSPNEAARSLVRGKSKILGVVLGNLRPLSAETHDPGNEYTLFVIEGITAAAGERGYHLFVFTNPWRENAETLETLRDRRSDGLILLAPPSDSGIPAELCDVGVRFVSVATPAEGMSVSSVDVDNVQGTRLALEHLLGLGHRRIAHVIGPPSAAGPRVRFDTYRALLAEAGIPYRPEYAVSGHDPDGNSSQQVRDTLRRLLSLPERPTAVFACDDTRALMTLQEAAHLGISVPDQLSVVGYDDRPIAPVMSPPLTTIRQPMARIGYTAANLLIDELEAEEAGAEPPAPKRVMLPVELVVRHSTAPPPH